jgi:FkbH-like protein
MATNKVSLDDLMAIGNLVEMRSALAQARLPLSLSQAQQLVERASTLVAQAPPLRLGIVHTYTSELLDPWLALEGALQGVELQTYHAPYGVTVQEAQESAGLVKHTPDVTLLLLQREDLHPDLTKPLVRLDVSMQAELRAAVLARLKAMVEQFRAHKIGFLLVSLLPPIQSPALGLFDAVAERSEARWWAALKDDLAEFLRANIEASLFLDLDEVLQEVGRAQFFDLRLWYSARFPFTPAAAREIARRVVALGAVIKLPKAKVIVLDADNTLWGGVIGEDGMDGIALGPDYPGNAFVDFQKRLLAYQQRGFILALCSKNNAADLDQVLREHPHQVLKDKHFAARRVNWTSKPENLISLAEELNLGLDSFIFVDDSDHECAAVRQRLPQVEVIQTPSRPIHVPGCLEHLARLEILSLTSEDLDKTEMYAQERQRNALKESIQSQGADMGDYLASLNMKMTVCLNNKAHLTRLSQLTQKTNQFNLTTRRYNEQQILEFIADPQWLVADFSLEDTFGNSGITGLALIHLVSPQVAEIDTFLMSCRVIGRQAEAAFLHCLLRHLLDLGVARVGAEFLPTPKNELARSFLPEQGFEMGADGRHQRVLSESSLKALSDFPMVVSIQT